MPAKTWTLIDVDRDIYVDELRLGPNDVGLPSGGFSVVKRTLRGGLRDGLNVVEIDNGALRATVLCDRGMGIWRVWSGGLEVGWPSPVKGPVHPKFVPLDEASGIGWLSGFDELLCRCGLEYNGAPEWSSDGKLKHTLHGRIANRPAHFVTATIDDDRQELAVTGVVDESRLFGNSLRLTSTVRTTFGLQRLTIVDEISNPWSLPVDLELLYHINIGPPLAAQGSTFDGPVEVMAPRDVAAVAGIDTWQAYEAGRPGAAETVLYMELAADDDRNTAVLLTDPSGERGLSLRFNRNEFPYFALWKNPISYSDGYCTGLEPCINFPNMKSFEQAHGRVAKVAPGETRRFQIEMEIHTDIDSLRTAQAQIADLQRRVEPRVFDEPRPEWSP
ncbi:MAG TPA: aldose 1-epimerase family protein [Pirellulales bacterium]|nr:aldose 1-epimerase family protein [Pirellulales bacterium]